MDVDRQSESQGLDGELVLKLEQDLKGARELRRQSRDEERTPAREQRPEFIRASKVMTFRPHSGGRAAETGYLVCWGARPEAWKAGGRDPQGGTSGRGSG